MVSLHSTVTVTETPFFCWKLSHGLLLTGLRRVTILCNLIFHLSYLSCWLPYSNLHPKEVQTLGFKVHLHFHNRAFALVILLTTRDHSGSMSTSSWVPGFFTQSSWHRALCVSPLVTYASSCPLSDIVLMVFTTIWKSLTVSSLTLVSLLQAMTYM